jgi:hypothetical protein
LAVVQTTSAQLTKDLGEFSTIKIYDRLTVSLISSSENKIVITGNRKEVEVVNNNGELIRMPFPKLLSGEDISIKLYFKI